MTRADAVSILIAAAQRLAVGRLPPVADSVEARELLQAMALLASDAEIEDLVRLGAHTFALLLDHNQALLLAQRELLRAQLAVARDEMPPHSMH